MEGGSANEDLHTGAAAIWRSGVAGRSKPEIGEIRKLFGKLFFVCLIVAGSCFGVEAERRAGMVLYFKSGEEVFRRG